MLGMAVGQFLGGPLSDQLGRRRIGTIGLAIFVISTILIVVSNSIDRKFANIIIVILIAPMFAPVLGTFLSFWGWRAIFWALALYGFLVMLIYLFVFPETNAELSEKFGMREVFKGYWAAISKRTNGRLIGLRLALFSGFNAGVLFSYVTNAAFIFIEHFHLTKMQFSGAFGAMILALMGGNRLTVFLLKRHPAIAIVAAVNLGQVVVATLLVLLCYLIQPSLWMIVIGLALLIGCYGSVSPAASGHFISLYDKNIGAASSLASTSVFAFGALIGGLSSVLANGQLLPIFAVMLASSLIARVLLLSARIGHR